VTLRVDLTLEAKADVEEVHAWYAERGMGRPEGGREATTGPAARRLTGSHSAARGRQLQPLVERRAALRLPREPLGERLDGVAGLWSEPRELAGLKETVGMDRGQLHDHSGASRIVERMREFLVSLLEQSVDGEVSLMVASRGVQPKGFQLVEHAAAEPLESYLP